MTNTNPQTTPADAADRPDSVVLIDVREHDEWNAGHAPGATHIPLGELRPEAIPPHASVLCVCRSGGRSAKATASCAPGIDATDVTGGMNAWAAAGLP